MQNHPLTIHQKQCRIYTSGSPKYLLIQPVDEHDLEVLDNEVAEIERRTTEPFILAAFRINDWNNELSPWEAPPVFGKQGFGSGAADTLGFIETELIPEIILRFELPENIPIVIGGYSLAGLFALWSVYNSERFSAAAAASPSVWFPKWDDYMRTHTPKADCVYLSLGNKEEKTKNKVMAAVGERIREQYELIKDRDCTLEWNEGSHFKEPDIRTAKAFAWCMEQLEKTK